MRLHELLGVLEQRDLDLLGADDLVVTPGRLERPVAGVGGFDGGDDLVGVGLVNAVREPADVEPAVVAWLEAASRGGAAVAAGRRAFYELGELGYDGALQSSLERFAAMFRDSA